MEVPSRQTGEIWDGDDWGVLGVCTERSSRKVLLIRV